MADAVAKLGLTHVVITSVDRDDLADVQPIGEHDLVTVDPLTWHQFHAAPDSALGFLCLVSKERDKPTLPRDDPR